MALIKADGLNYETADTYADVSDARTYASNRGVTLSADDDTLEIDLRKAIDYLESFRARFKGDKTYEDSLLQFPRTNVYVDGYLIEEDDIPQLIVDAQCQLTMDLFAGVTLQPNLTGGFIVWQQVGPIIRRFSEKVGARQQPHLTAFQGLIKPLLKSGSNIGTVIRG